MKSPGDDRHDDRGQQAGERDAGFELWVRRGDLGVEPATTR